jgi:hypothetical protein
LKVNGKNTRNGAQRAACPSSVHSGAIGDGIAALMARGFPEISAIFGSLASSYNPAFVTAEGTIAGAEAAL